MVLTPSSGTPRRIVDVGQDVAVVALSMAGAISALDGSRWSLLWVAASLAGVGFQLTRVWQAGRNRWTPLGRAMVLRGSAATATGVALGSLSPGAVNATLATLATAVLVGCLAGEPFVARAERFRVPVASGLPGVPPVREQSDLGPTA
ncbi:MAG: CDP-Glycerol:Poly(Glycerophosphate) glycerophosphotransferase, partial [Friedmanniella sp.]|nr:CDP-Glycerol:Poly(Glycerophosphate) glycerophosphotransferase [Friedmanniella sp.]